MSTGITPATWDQNAFETLMNAEAKDRRAGRKIFQPDASQNKYLKNVDEYVTSDTTLTMGKGLQPMTVSTTVSISLDAQEDPGLRAFAARQLGDAFCFAEDAIVLLGAKARIPSPRGAVAIAFDSKALKEQQGLFDGAKDDVDKGQVIVSTIKALNNLRNNGHHGPFVVIVGTELNEEAWTPATQGIVSPPITIVLPELRSPTDGWIWSDVVDKRKGVAISLGGESFDFIVCYDSHVESALVTSTFDIEATVQVRLRINDPTAIEPLPKKAAA